MMFAICILPTMTTTRLLGTLLTTRDEVLAAVCSTSGIPVSSVVTIGLFGSVDFYNADSEALCVAIGAGLALALPDKAVILTGANAIVQEKISRSFHDTRGSSTTRVYHLAPDGFTGCDWGFGEVLMAGQNMAERRELLAGTSAVGISVEGGPGTADEMSLLLSSSSSSSSAAVLLPLARTGGASSGMFGAPAVARPEAVSEADWALLADSSASVDSSAAAMVRAVVAVLARLET